MKQPFARFLSIMTALSKLMGAGMSRMDAVNLTGAANYRSRGKGKGLPSPRFGRSRSKCVPHIGAKEQAKWAAKQVRA
jgi:hypothetical protein